MKLYRIMITTGTPQDRDCGQMQVAEVLYCGYDREEAARVYHASKPLDFGGGNYTGRTRWTIAQSKEIATAVDAHALAAEHCRAVAESDAQRAADEAMFDR